MAISILGYKSTLGLQSILCNKYIENIQTLSEYSMFFAFNNQIDTKMKRIATLLKFRKRIILLEILKRRKCVWMEYGSEWAYNDIDVGLLESMLSKPNINIIILFQKNSFIH